MRGRVIDAVLARCGGSTRVNEGSPLSIFAVAVSQSNEVVIAGVESLDQGDTSRLVVRRYGLPSCPLSAASTSVTSSLASP